MILNNPHMFFRILALIGCLSGIPLLMTHAEGKALLSEAGLTAKQAGDFSRTHPGTPLPQKIQTDVNQKSAGLLSAYRVSLQDDHQIFTLDHEEYSATELEQALFPLLRFLDEHGAIPLQAKIEEGSLSQEFVNQRLLWLEILAEQSKQKLSQRTFRQIASAFSHPENISQKSVDALIRLIEKGLVPEDGESHWILRRAIPLLVPANRTEVRNILLRFITSTGDLASAGTLHALLASRLAAGDFHDLYGSFPKCASILIKVLSAFPADDPGLSTLKAAWKGETPTTPQGIVQKHLLLSAFSASAEQAMLDANLVNQLTAHDPEKKILIGLVTMGTRKIPPQFLEAGLGNYSSLDQNVKSHLLETLASNAQKIETTLGLPHGEALLKDLMLRSPLNTDLIRLTLKYPTDASRAS
jgi:hypothetical protein